jgi:hypothetical protein
MVTSEDILLLDLINPNNPVLGGVCLIFDKFLQSELSINV